MADDPYSKWLGLPAGPRPPKAHELLGLPANPTNAAQIDAAAGRRMDQLDQYALSNDRATRSQVQQLMNEVAMARTKLVAKVPKPKPKSVVPAPTDVPQPRTQAKDQPTAKPVLYRASQASALTPESFPKTLPSIERSTLSDRTKSGIVFWSLITAAWAATLAAVFAVTYIIIAPETPEPTRDTVLAALGSTSDAAVTAQKAEQPDADSGAQIDEPEPVGPTGEELAAQQAEQERLALEMQQAEQQRLAAERKMAEQQREQERRQQQAKQRRLEEERKQAIERQQQEELRRQALAKQKWRKDYFAERDRLRGDAKVNLIKRAFSEWNDGHQVEIEPEFENGRLVAIDLKSKINQHKNRLTDLTPLAGLELRQLKLTGRSIKTLAPLKGMPLEQLELDWCENLEDISALKGMSLNSFAMSNAVVEDLESLRGMPLTTFYMNKCRQITTLAPLKGAELSSVHISNCSKLVDLNGLESMKAEKLKAVFFSNLRLTDLTALKGLTFNHLSIKESGHFKSLEFLQGVTVHVLELEAEQVADLTPLKRANIQHMLKLDGDQITDLTPLAKLRCRYITLNCMSLVSLKGLESMPNLQSVSSYKQIPEKEVKRLNRAKPDLRVKIYN